MYGYINNLNENCETKEQLYMLSYFFLLYYNLVAYLYYLNRILQDKLIKH